MSGVECEHRNFDSSVEIARLEDIGRFNASVSISCSDCGVEMEFMGLPYGLILDGAATSPSRREARLAIKPKDADVPNLEGAAARGYTIKISEPENDESR